MKALKITIAVVVGLGLLMAFSIHVMGPEARWQHFADKQHCKLISGSKYQCDSGTFTKP